MTNPRIEYGCKYLFFSWSLVIRPSQEIPLLSPPFRSNLEVESTVSLSLSRVVELTFVSLALFIYCVNTVALQLFKMFKRAQWLCFPCNVVLWYKVPLIWTQSEDADTFGTGYLKMSICLFSNKRSYQYFKIEIAVAIEKSKFLKFCKSLFSFAIRSFW